MISDRSLYPLYLSAWRRYQWHSAPDILVTITFTESLLKLKTLLSYLMNRWKLPARWPDIYIFAISRTPLSVKISYQLLFTGKFGSAAHSELQLFKLQHNSDRYRWKPAHSLQFRFKLPLSTWFVWDLRCLQFNVCILGRFHSSLLLFKSGASIMMQFSLLPFHGFYFCLLFRFRGSFP